MHNVPPPGEKALLQFMFVLYFFVWYCVVQFFTWAKTGGFLVAVRAVWFHMKSCNAKMFTLALIVLSWCCALSDVDPVK